MDAVPSGGRSRACGVQGIASSVLLCLSHPWILSGTTLWKVISRTAGEVVNGETVCKAFRYHVIYGKASLYTASFYTAENWHNTLNFEFVKKDRMHDFRLFSCHYILCSDSLERQFINSLAWNSNLFVHNRHR